MNNIASLIAFACLAALVAGSAIVLTDKLGLIGLAIVGVVVVVGWLVATWYYRDNTPVFAPDNTPGRVTFKQVVVDALHDIAALTRPVWMRLWLNLQFVAVIAVDAVALATPQLREALFIDSPIGGAVLVVLTLVARYGSTPAHPPIASR